MRVFNLIVAFAAILSVLSACGSKTALIAPEATVDQNTNAPKASKAKPTGGILD